MERPVVAVVIPTRDRVSYLDVALGSLARQEDPPEHEIVVVDDGSGPGTDAVAGRHGARVVRPGPPGGLNAGRNAGVAATAAPLVAFLDDDVLAAPGWLRALAHGADAHGEADAFGGPIRARFEGPTPSSCGRETPPITTLDLGPADREADMVWGANMAVRRSALERLGPFDPRVHGHGDEEDWLLALRAQGGRIVYLAAAAVEHRRAPGDAGLLALSRAAYRRGRAARATDARRGNAPGLGRELTTLAGCAGHLVRYRCPQGAVMGAHSAGRVASALRAG